jgi:hypothetical protein
MNTICRLLTLLLASTLTASFLGACSGTVGAGDTGISDFTSVKIKTEDSSLLGTTIVDVFVEKGFRHVSTGSTVMTFEKQGSGTTDFVWGNNMNNNPTIIVATVNIIPEYGKKLYQVTCAPTIKQASRISGYSEKKPILMGRLGYQGMLDEIKKRVEKGTY